MFLRNIQYPESSFHIVLGIPTAMTSSPRLLCLPITRHILGLLPLLLALPSSEPKLCDPGDYFLNRPNLMKKMVGMLEKDCEIFSGTLHVNGHSLERLTMPRLQHADSILIDIEAKSFVELNLPQLTSLGSLRVMNARALEALNLPKLETLGSLIISDTPRTVGLSLPSLQVGILTSRDTIATRCASFLFRVASAVHARAVHRPTVFAFTHSVVHSKARWMIFHAVGRGRPPIQSGSIESGALCFRCLCNMMSTAFNRLSPLPLPLCVPCSLCFKKNIGSISITKNVKLTDVCLERPINMTQKDSYLTIEHNADTYFCLLMDPASNVTGTITLPPVRMPGHGRECPKTCPTMGAEDKSLQHNVWLVLLVASLVFVCCTTWDTHRNRCSACLGCCSCCNVHSSTAPKRGCFVGVNQRLII